MSGTYYHKFLFFCSSPDSSVSSADPLSTKAFKLLVGMIRCGNLGEPLTRSRSDIVGGQSDGLRLSGNWKLTRGTSPSHPGSSSTSPPPNRDWAAFSINAVEILRCLWRTKSDGSTMSTVELIAVPLFAIDIRRRPQPPPTLVVFSALHEAVPLPPEGTSPDNSPMCAFRAVAIPLPAPPLPLPAIDVVDCFRELENMNRNLLSRPLRSAVAC